MADERKKLPDWHRLFGLLLADFFADSPFTVEVERDVSIQQQFLDIVVVRRGSGQMAVRLPDGLDDLAAHNLITFKSHHEALDSWAMKELVGHYVAYRKMVSPSTSALLPEDEFRLYAVCARFPDKLSRDVELRQQQPGVYHCRWGTDDVGIVVAGQLSREPHNAPLHLFSASPELVGFGQGAYQHGSDSTSVLLKLLFIRFRGEGFSMSYTIEDLKRDTVKEYFKELSPAEQREVIQSLPPGGRQDIVESLPIEDRRKMIESLPLEDRLAGLNQEQIREFFERSKPTQPPAARKPRRKK